MLRNYDDYILHNPKKILNFSHTNNLMSVFIDTSRKQCTTLSQSLSVSPRFTSELDMFQRVIRDKRKRKQKIMKKCVSHRSIYYGESSAPAKLPQRQRAT